ncbi:hypothetical protein MTBSS4_210096 [Magnetospirillum sp. SS-4]|nr:hypothetical protein MTBSS4_210096 [Magnetospirillum sp. SS-4]
MGLRETIKERMDEIQSMIESNQRDGINEKISSVAKFWGVLGRKLINRLPSRAVS